MVYEKQHRMCLIFKRIPTTCFPATCASSWLNFADGKCNYGGMLTGKVSVLLGSGINKKISSWGKKFLIFFRKSISCWWTWNYLCQRGSVKRFWNFVKTLCCK
jgi:hypothetical protein